MSIPGRKEDHSPRPQRRHFFDARGIQGKILRHEGSVEAIEPGTTYQIDFINQYDDPTVPKDVERHIRRRFDPSLAPLADLEALNKSVLSRFPKQKDADDLLYKSTYQENYNKTAKIAKNTIYAPPQALDSSPQRSLYNDSYETSPPIDMRAIGNPGKEHAMTKTFDVDQQVSDLTIRDVIPHTSKKNNYITSYNCDFRGFKRSGAQVKPQIGIDTVIRRVDRTNKYQEILRH